MSTAEWVISSEEDAWALLKEACGDRLAEAVSFKFDKWPILDIKLEGADFNSTISTKMMEGFIELQKNINRTYSKLYYNQANSRLLTEEEKKHVELFVQVLPGSSDFKIDLQKIMEKFIEGVSNKVTGKQVVIIAIAGGLMWTGNSMWKSYLQTQKDIKGIDMQRIASAEETKRLEIFASAIKHEPSLVATKVDAEEIYNKILKASAKADRVQLPGISLKGSEAKQLVRPTRSPSSEVRLDGVYRVIKIDNSKADHFEVRVTDGTELFTAKLDQSVIISRDENKKILEQALWSREPVKLMIQGTRVRDEITQATILDVMDRYTKEKEASVL